jgi:site-specific DNA-methyltransferase (adenine-specific)
VYDRRAIAMNQLFLGDNLEVLARHVGDASVDLVVLDPPFQSGKDYGLARRTRGCGQPTEPVFTDTWRWGPEADDSYRRVAESRSDAAVTLSALRTILGESDVMAYLAMMAPRLIELRRTLRPSGSLYLHCDPTASHYLKVLLDGVFGAECFRNEIIWRYRRWPTKARRFQRMHDVLLFYTASDAGIHTFNTLYGYETLAASTLKTFGTKRQRADFSSGHRKPGIEQAESSGPPLSDYWEDPSQPLPDAPLSDGWEIGVIAAIGKERTGYPTQKPEALLERMVRASSRDGDLVLDPFCGCGTTLAVADRLGRRWIGVDISPVAVDLAAKRLRPTSFEVRRVA